MKKLYFIIAVLLTGTFANSQTCHRINFPPPAGWTPLNYYTGATVGADGWINGVNVYLDKQKAMYFDASATNNTFIVQTYIAFGMAYSANPAKVVPVHVYDGTSGTPGALLGTENLTMARIMADKAANSYSSIEFDPPIALPVSKKFFVSVDLTNLEWNTTTHDTLAIVSNSNGQTIPADVWEQQSNNTWYQYNTAGSWPINISLLIHPFLTTTPVDISLAYDKLSVCQGETITFDATGSTAQDTLVWVFNGANNVVVVDSLVAHPVYNIAGNHWTYLYIIGGGCGQFRQDSVQVTVKPKPDIGLAISNTALCTGDSATLTASGGVSYTWSPTATLSAATGATVTAKPAANTTYTLSGTGANGCTKDTTFTIAAAPPSTPVISITGTDSVICAGREAMFTAVLQHGGTAPQVVWQVGNSVVATGNQFTTTNLLNGNQVNAQLISNAACITADTVLSNIITMDVIPAATINLNGSICDGDSYTFHEKVLTTAGIYRDTLVGNNSCDSIVTLSLTVHDIPQPVITQSGNTLSTGNYTSYQWVRDSAVITGATSQTLTVQQPGNYMVLVTGAGGCAGASAELNVVVSSVSETAATNISLYPNPTNGNLFINATGLKNIEVYNLLGELQTVKAAIKTNNTHLSLTDLASGIYLLRIQTANNTTLHRVVLSK